MSGDEASRTAPTAQAEADYLRTVLASVPAFVIRLDAELRIRFINRVQPGFSLPEVIGRASLEFIDPQYHAIYLETVERVLRTGESGRYAGVAAGPDGGLAHYETRVERVRDPDGTMGVTLIAIDVTEHVRRAEDLRESEAKLRLAVDATRLGLWTWEAEGDRVWWNARMHEITGVAEALPPSRYIATVVHPDDRARMEASIQQIEAGSSAFQMHRILRPDGELRWALPCGSVLRHPDGSVARLMGGILDVTAEQRAEERVRHAQKMDAIGSLTTGLAHNFNNMLAVIVPALQIAMGNVPPHRVELIEGASHAAQRATELVAQLMTFAGKHRSVDRKVVDLTVVVNDAAAMCRRTFGNHFNIAVRPQSTPLWSECVDSNIEQVLINLLINARDAIDEAGRRDPRITVSLDTARRAGAPDQACIAIADNGKGMLPEVVARLFEPFFTTKPPGRGTGLGLATSFAILREHGGSIRCETTPDVGSTFIVQLPLFAAGTAR